MNYREALLMKYPYEWFHEQAKAITEKESDNEEIGTVVAYYTDGSLLNRKLLLLKDEEVRLLESAVKQDGIVPSRTNYRAADRLCALDLGFIDAEKKLIIPEEVSDVYLAINTIDFHDLRSKISWLYDCLRLVGFFYGVISVSDFGRLYRRKKGMEDPNEEIIMRLYPLVYDAPAVISDGEIMNRGVRESGNLDKLKQMHERVAVGIPSYSELKDIVENGYPSKNKQYQQLRQFMIRTLNLDVDYSEALLSALHEFIAKGNTYADIMNLLEQENIKPSENDEQLLKYYLGECWDNTRMLLCNGNCPADVMPYHRDIFFQQ